MAAWVDYGSGRTADLASVYATMYARAIRPLTESN